MQAILTTRVVPAATVDDVDLAVPLAEALLEGGLNVLEITFRTEAAAACVREIAKRVPDMYLGAGTILTAHELQRAYEAGAKFAVAPGLVDEVVTRASEIPIPLIPGVATPTEISRAILMNCTYLKFFPAAPLGGIGMLAAISGPFVHKGVKFMPTGGVDASNAAEYLALPTVCAVGGSWMVKRDLVAARRWKDITKLAREAVRLCALA
ncbi:MAG: bifunctional 4-hydroxy-2-oxoglutarate aldolase/2-dehydro-3-deoxy-phosphogluconate aldolase [Lentisphaerae bacterium]|nr:bifunctional 4-hydroxy-2-oxoglutarate aldolase/2-dehydro-3-deoxy-phosphogluconate aldolase [Lentisphaerota bacterium]